MKRIAAAITALALAAPAAAQQEPAPRLWQQMTLADVEAAHRLLSEDHPGALEEVGDAEFRHRLDEAYRTARSRAERVTGLSGYLATMLGFGNALGDKHIRSRPLATPVTLDWPGLLVARRGSSYVVAVEDNAAEGAPLSGATLVSCDGTPAEQLAEQRLGGFRAVWSIGAQRTMAAPWLMVDDGNPFLTRPARCTFDQAGARREVELRWRTARRAEVTGRMADLVRTGSPGMGVRRSGEGWWISLQTLSDDARQVVDAVRARAAEIRRAPYVVLDMRGNGGGNSVYGDLIAEAILGPSAARGAGGGESEQCNPVWRISDRNLRVLEEVARGASERMGEQAGAFWAGQYRRAVEGRAAGRSLTAPPRCQRSASARRASRQPAARRPAYAGRLILLTDHACFSSCLIVTDRWRQLGATHVGDATDAATHYFEVREEPMPSGLSMFSTLQALSPSTPPQIGPFVPELIYEGDISDTEALEGWVARIASEPRRSGSRTRS